MCDNTKPVCGVCGKSYASNSGLYKHLRSAHDIQPETVKAATSESSGDFQCYVCDRTFVQKSSLTRHLKDIHNVENHEDASEKTSSFQCDQCPKSYQLKKDLNKHIKLKHGGKSSFHTAYFSRVLLAIS